MSEVCFTKRTRQTELEDIKLLASIFIVVMSALLLHYWFRYTCLLILSTRTGKDYTQEVAVANRMTFLEIARVLASAASKTLAVYQKSLDREYQLVTYLMGHASSLRPGGDRLELAMLRLDYHLMRLWFFVTRRYSEAHARRSVEEMSQIVAHFANALGQRLAIANPPRL